MFYPLDVIAESNKCLYKMSQRLVALQHTALRLQACALTMIGLALVGIGVLTWYAITEHQDHALLIQALTAATRALEQRMH
jgi:hypothetical protein